MSEPNTNAVLLKLFDEIEDHLLMDQRPSIFLNSIYQDLRFCQYPFSMLRKLKQVEQSVKYHPEGDVWNHTMMVVDEAARRRGRSKNPKILMWAALLHDIGKEAATKVKKGRITAHQHDLIGAKLAGDFLTCFLQEPNIIEQISQLIRYHMQILYVIKGLNFADLQCLKRHTDIEELALLGLCDRLGRGNRNVQAEQEVIRRFLAVCGENG